MEKTKTERDLRFNEMFTVDVPGGEGRGGRCEYPRLFLTAAVKEKKEEENEEEGESYGTTHTERLRRGRDTHAKKARSECGDWKKRRGERPEKESVSTVREDPVFVVLFGELVQ